MAPPSLTWRLEEGYSRFLEGSEIEIAFRDGPITSSLDIFPLSSVRQKKPVEGLFQVRKTFSGAAGGGLRWRVTPQSEIRALLLFAGNPFLGNFRVPAGHFAVQWDVEARAEGALGETAVPFLLAFSAGTRLYQSWVSVFSEDVSVAAALKTAWQRYRDPFNPVDVWQLGDREVIRWRWEGHAQVAADFSWGIGSAWAIPGRIPGVSVKKEIAGVAGLSASLFAREEGHFSLQLRRQRNQLMFHLVRDRSRQAGGSVTLGVQLREPLRFEQFGFSKPEPLHVVSEGLGQPVIAHLNRIVEESLARRLNISLSVSRKHWQSEKNLLKAAWRDSSLADFSAAYCQLLSGQMPDKRPGLEAISKFEFVRAKSVSLQLGFLDWLGLRNVRQTETKRIVTVGPTGEIVIEQSESLEKTTHRWDGIQFFSLVSRELTDREEQGSSVWTWAVEEEMGQERLRGLLRMALHSGIIREFSMPAKTVFPVRIRLVLGTRFSRQGLEEVKLTPQTQKWKALIKAFELVELDNYSPGRFWRDWIDSPKLRSLVDREPVQADTLTRYPVSERTQAERTLVISRYRSVRQFLALLEHWKRNEIQYVVRCFELGMDIPIFVFFHLLCPPELRSSAAILTGGLDQTWGDIRLFENS